MAGFPEPPYNRLNDRMAWLQFWNRFTAVLTADNEIFWADVNKTGSTLADLDTRDHSDLTNILQASETSTDGTRNRHLSSNDLYIAEQHRNNNTADQYSSDPTRNKHLSNNDLRLTYDHRADLANPHAVTQDQVTASVSSKTTTYTVTSSDCVILADTSGGAFTLTLPDAATNAGRMFHIKLDTKSGALTIAPTGSDTIDGDTSVLIDVEKTTITVVGVSGDWKIL